ncbi:hypothetical protein HPB48_006878 [Haemaphysalis longicornis]|uniref:Uncharacterized protein n=1 Tax=Haemaphysalis longicornis TaxID=44386 RepID=A0A9J6FHE6_HAELO|nr:hypothetical protein HPB48_006878 [Haemaphysalis longicornis]
MSTRSKDVRLPVQLQRAMAAEAEAAREARAKLIAAEGEQKSSRALKEAADVMSLSPAALQLRYLQTLNTISAEKNSTIIFPLPIDFLACFMPDKKKHRAMDADPWLGLGGRGVGHLGQRRGQVAPLPVKGGTQGSAIGPFVRTARVRALETVHAVDALRACQQDPVTCIFRMRAFTAGDMAEAKSCEHVDSVTPSGTLQPST